MAIDDNTSYELTGYQVIDLAGVLGAVGAIITTIVTARRASL